MSAILNDIFDLFVRFGSGDYGEDISLEEHMLQAAGMAESLDAPRNVVVAALLHDIGYFLRADSEHAISEGRNVAHETLGADWLSRGFAANVTVPIALHVQAKRYLCAVEPAYFSCLSEASRLSLAIQGGIMSEAEAAAFAQEPAFESAVILRRCDDRGKDVALRAQNIERYRDILTAALK